MWMPGRVHSEHSALGWCSGTVGTLVAFADVCVFHSDGYAPACDSSYRSKSVSSTTASLYQPASHAHGEWKGLAGRGPGTGEGQHTGVRAVKRLAMLLSVTLCAYVLGFSYIRLGLFKTVKLGMLFLPLCVRGDTEAP